VHNLLGLGAASMHRPTVSDPALRRLVRDLYKGKGSPSQLGTGSTADAIRSELRTGQPTQGIFHYQKGQQYANALCNWLQQHPNADPADRSAAQDLLHDLTEALHGR
jgi:hypothetical protein